MPAPKLRTLIFRVLVAMPLVHAAWWYGDMDQWVLSALKVPMESIIPLAIDEIVRVTKTPEAGGGWALLTTVLINGSSNAVLISSAFILAKCVFWIPSALALVLATVPTSVTKLLLGAFAAFSLAGLLILVCAAAQLGILLNPEPNLWSDLNPRPPGMTLSVGPYPDWVFFLVSLGFYFTLNVATLALPIILWAIICWREIGELLSRLSKARE